MKVWSAEKLLKAGVDFEVAYRKMDSLSDGYGVAMLSKILPEWKKSEEAKSRIPLLKRQMDGIMRRGWERCPACKRLGWKKPAAHTMQHVELDPAQIEARELQSRIHKAENLPDYIVYDPDKNGRSAQDTVYSMMPAEDIEGVLRAKDILRRALEKSGREKQGRQVDKD
jgi:hypothetical protein